jgi:hypothetical protein
MLMMMCKPNVDWVTYKPPLSGKPERFIKIGRGGEGLRPKEFYDLEGNLLKYPVQDENILNLRTKSQKNVLTILLAAAPASLTTKNNDETPSPITKKSTMLPSPSKTISPKGMLFEYIRELIAEAGAAPKSSDRTWRTLQRMITSCVDLASKELVHALLEKYAVGQDTDIQESKLAGLSAPPDAVFLSAAAPLATDGVVVHEVSEFGSPTLQSPGTWANPLAAVDNNENNPVILEFYDEDDDVELDAGGDEDEQSIGSSTTNEFLSELKEEVVLQSLLHKRIHDRNERVFQLQHRNGRRLLVVLPPDFQSVSAFEEEAKRTKWVDTMLNTDERVEGMLSHLAKTNPKVYEKVGKNRKISMKPAILSTTQTIALAQVGALNDTRMKQFRSFLRNVGKVNLQMTNSEIGRINVQVGLHQTKPAVFGRYIHEWALTKGKEKKAPEQVHYWNSTLSSEIEAEVDLYLHHLFHGNTNDPPLQDIPVLDYAGDGFVNPGVTVLFGGDHGDKHCPISCKFNLSPPIVQKEKKKLGYQCPMIVFGSVECTKDTYKLMNKTVMPIVKDQLKELQSSSIVTVYHRSNKTKAFR